ncbi:MAG: acyl-CoA dehydrogenase family protein [Gemmatimonadota bacterium]
MDFELSKEQKDIQKAARRFAKGEFDRELALELEEKHEFPTEIWKKAADEGFMGLHYPEEYGGSGYGVMENTLVVEEFCRRDSGIGAALMTADFASENVLRYGTHEQKERYLPPIAEGTAISAGAITEPEHGSDITSMATMAVRDADEWVIKGVKTFITNAGIADDYVVVCQTDP